MELAVRDRNIRRQNLAFRVGSVDEGHAVDVDGSDIERAAAVAANADVAVVVVGYTYLDEGEYIGETDAWLPTMFPKADEPEVAERFEASIADLPPTTKPEHVIDRGKGFSTGGDRETLRLLPADVELIHAVAAIKSVVVIRPGSVRAASASSRKIAGKHSTASTNRISTAPMMPP